MSTFMLGLFLSGLVVNCRGFVVSNSGATVAHTFITPTVTQVPLRLQLQQQQNDYRKSFLQMSLNAEEDDDEEEDDEEVGKMRISEIKAELKLRGTDFSDCFDKDSLSKRLLDARCKGKADPSIIDQFNQQSKNVENKVELDDDVLNKAAGGDGTLPGGMPPDMLKQLMSNPELVALLQDPKMQDVMKLMMTGGQDTMQEKMSSDPEVYELVMKLNRIMAKAM